MEVATADRWLPLKEMSPVSAEEDRDSSSPITIVAQDFLDDPPVRDIPATPPSRPPPHRPASNTPPPAPPPPAIDVSHAIAATASAVASSIPLTQLQRSIDTFCSALIARTEHRSQDLQPDRYALRMIEDLDFIKHQLSRPDPAPAPEPQRHLLTEFQSEVRQLKLRLEEQSSLARIYRPLTDIQDEISSLKTALTNRNIPTALPSYHTAAVNTPSSKLVSKECQTQVCQPETKRVAPSVSIQTSPPVRSPLPRKPQPLPSPIQSSSPLSRPPAPLHPPLRLSHLERRLREIKINKKQLEHRPSHATHSLPLSDIVQQVLNREGEDMTSRAQQLVTDKLHSIRPADSDTDGKPSKRDSKRKSQRGESSGYRHEKDPVYISRVYGQKQVQAEKKDNKSTKTGKTPTNPKPKSSEGEIERVYKQIEKIQLHIEQLASRHPPPPPPPPPPVVTATATRIAPLTPQHAPTRKQQTVRLMRPPRLVPSPYTPPPEETQLPRGTNVPFVTCDNAQVQTSLLSADTPGMSRHTSPVEPPSPPHREVRTSHTQTEAPMEIVGGDRSPSLTRPHSVSTDREESSQLLEQIISLQGPEADPGDSHLDPSPHPAPLHPGEALREQELGRRHLLARVQQMLAEKTSRPVPVSDQARLSEARRRGEREREVSAAVEGAIKREILSCIRAARQDLREKREEPDEPLESEQEEAYSMSFASESAESPSPDLFPSDEQSPYSPTFSLPPRPLPLPLSATPEPPSPRTRAFLQRSPPTYRAASPESPAASPCPSPVHMGVQCSGESLLTPHREMVSETSSPISEEIQCDLNNTLTNLRPSPPPLSPEARADVPSRLNPLSTSNTPVLSPINPSVLCDTQKPPTPLPPPSPQVHAEIQCDLRQGAPLPIRDTPFLSPPPLPTSTPLPQVHTGVQCELKEVTPVLPPPPPHEASSTLPSDTTDFTPSADSDYPSYVSEGEYVPPGGRDRYRESSDVISVGEVPPFLSGGQLSPAVEAALILKGFVPDPSGARSPGEYLPPRSYQPTRSHLPPGLFHQPEGIFSSGGSGSPLTPALPAMGASPGEAAADPSPSESDHLSRSVTLSIAFSSPSNKTTTRHRDGVDVFDVSALEGLSVPVGWDLSQMNKGEDTQDIPGDKTHPPSGSHTPSPPQPDHVDLQLDGSSNSTSCDIHSLSSLSREAHST